MIGNEETMRIEYARSKTYDDVSLTYLSNPHFIGNPNGGHLMHLTHRDSDFGALDLGLLTSVSTTLPLFDLDLAKVLIRVQG